MPRIGTAPVRQTTLNRHAGAQTKQMPMVAIECHHLDSIHGPSIVSPLDLAVDGIRIYPKVAIDTEQFKSTKDKPTQTDFNWPQESVGPTQSVAVQTNFTSFTRPTHYNYPDSRFDRFLILDASEDLSSNAVEKQAKEFNQEIFGRYGYLFPLKFIARYFLYHFQNAKLEDTALQERLSRL